MKEWVLLNLLANGKLISKKCKKEWFEKNGYLKEYQKILNDTSFLDFLNPTFPQRIWHIYYNKYTVNKCKNPSCVNSTSFLTFTKGYSDTCSYKCAQLNPDTIRAIKDTNLKKYGVEYGLSNKKIIEKRKLSLLKNYGVDNPTKSDLVLSKIAQNNKLKYGVEWILEDQNKKESGILKKYGVKNVQQVRDIKEKTIKTHRKKFYNSLFSTDRLNQLATPLFSEGDYIINGINIRYKFKCNKCEHVFYDGLEDGDVPRCPICFNGQSFFENEVFDFIKSIIYKNDVVLLKNVQNIIPNNKLELDIYIPHLRLAIECDGLFWHGELNGKKDKFYHLHKTEKCESQNIRLIHIFEDEWLFKRDIVESRLKNILGITDNKVYARNCQVKEISSKECENFLLKNHIQGKDKSSIRFGLIHNNELLSVMTFGKLRRVLGNKQSNDKDYEMYRFCNKTNYNIAGAAGKLLSHFINQYHPNRIISYADRRWSWIHDNLYKKLGFSFISYTPPNYWYFGKNKKYKRYHRFGFAKYTLKNRIENFNPILTEWENMKNNGWDRIWDCGNIKYQMELK